MIQSILNWTNILADSDKIGGKTVFAQEKNLQSVKNKTGFFLMFSFAPYRKFGLAWQHHTEAASLLFLQIRRVVFV